MAGDTGAPGFLPLYDDTTSFAPIQDPFNGISQALNLAVKKNAFTTYATLATLNLPANVGTVVGQHATVNADTINNGDYTWTGTAWALVTPGVLQYRSAATTGAFTNAFVSKASVTLPAGNWDLSAIVEVNHSTATPHIYDAQIYNLTDATIITSGQLYMIAGSLRLTLNIGETLNLPAQKTIQLRAKIDGAEGTQLISGGRLRATKVGVLL